MSNIKRLPEAELEVMMAVWSSSVPVNSAYIMEKLKDQRSWALGTLLTVLNRLTEKGFLACERHYRNNLYRPIVSECSYKQSEGKTILEKLYGNSFTSLVTSLYDADSISANDLDELQRFIDSIKEGKQ